MFYLLFPSNIGDLEIYASDNISVVPRCWYTYHQQGVIVIIMFPRGLSMAKRQEEHPVWKHLDVKGDETSILVNTSTYPCNDWPPI
jgi:hypothetical protein